MATSPPSELRILNITEFHLSDKDGQWYWHTETLNDETVGDGSEGYLELRKAIAGFFAQQGFEPERVTDPSDQHYSKLYKISDSEYHIRRYALGAPDPFDPNNFLALATQGWQPPAPKEVLHYE